MCDSDLGVASTVRIVVLSDTHCQHTKLTVPECDLLLHAGDITTFGSEKEAYNFLSWFDQQPAKYKILVPGNHDKSLESYPIDSYKSVQILYGQRTVELAEFGNLKVFGAPGALLPSKFYKGHQMWAFGDMDDELEKRWKNIPLDTDILVTHNPPYGMQDKITSGRHVGSKSLLARIQRSQVKLHVFGHIHEDGGHALQEYNDQDGNSKQRLFVNAAVLGHFHDLIRSVTRINLVLQNDESGKRTHQLQVL